MSFSVAGPVLAAQLDSRSGDQPPAWRCDSGIWAETVLWRPLWWERRWLATRLPR